MSRNLTLLFVLFLEIGCVLDQQHTSGPYDHWAYLRKPWISDLLRRFSSRRGCIRPEEGSRTVKSSLNSASSSSKKLGFRWARRNSSVSTYSNCERNPTRCLMPSVTSIGPEAESWERMMNPNLFLFTIPAAISRYFSPKSRWCVWKYICENIRSAWA